MSFIWTLTKDQSELETFLDCLAYITYTEYLRSMNFLGSRKINIKHLRGEGDVGLHVACMMHLASMEYHVIDIRFFLSSSATFSTRILLLDITEESSL